MKEYPISLIMPPSENACWFNMPGRGRVCTTEYQKWKKKAAQDLMMQKIPKFHNKDYQWGLGFMDIFFKRKRRGRAPDAPNFLKPIIDAVSSYIGIDDNIHKHIFQGGYKPCFTDGLEIITTSILIYDDNKKEILNVPF